MDSSPTSRTDQRPRPKSAFSFRSHRSSESGSSRPKIDDLVETEKERRKSRYTGKDYSNPNRAINDAQPIAVAQEAATLAPLRASQYKDWKGNDITDPDPSNPSRPRLERPLDTIRSFEAAVDSSYKRRTQVLRTESAGDVLNGNDSRRSSVVGTDYNINPRSPAAIPGPTMYKSSSGRRPPAQQDGYNQYPQYSRGPPPNAYRRNMAPRQHSAPLQHRSSQYDYNGYPQPSYADPYETAGDSSGSPSEPWAASTDPSSENSSIDRINTLNRQPENDAYGHQFGRGSPKNAPIAEEQNNLEWTYEQSYENEPNSPLPPPPPPHQQPRQSREYDSRPPVAVSGRSHQTYQRPGPVNQPQPQPQYQSRQPPPPQSPQYQPQQQQQQYQQQPQYQQSQQQSKQPQYTAPPNRYPPTNGGANNPFRAGRDKPLPPPSSHQPQRPRTLQKKTSDPPKRQSWFKRTFGKS